MSAVASATSTALAVRDDDAYRRRLSRLADRRSAAAATAPPGARPRPARSSSSSTASATTCCWRGRTGRADRAADGRPSPRWTRRHPPAHPLAHRLVQPDRRQPARHPARHQPRRARLPLVREGHRRGHGLQPARRAPPNSSAAPSSAPATAGCSPSTAPAAATSSAAAPTSSPSCCRWRPGAARRNRSRAGYFAYFSDPANAVRTAVSFVAEVVREIGQSTAGPAARASGRGSGAAASTPFIRAFATVVERDVVVAAVIGRHARRAHRRLRRPGRLRRGGPPLRAAQPRRRDRSSNASTGPSR